MSRIPNDTVIGGRYRVTRLLGAGGMGSVYEAVDAQSGERVAVKVITAEVAASETLMGRFEREARAAAEIDTPHIVRVLGSGRDAELRLPFLVMEYLEGEDLSQLIKRMGALPAELALRIAMQACAGLEKAHEARIVHRDIKPANFFLAKMPNGDRVVKLLDFGVAKIKRDPEKSGAETAGLTRTGSMLGSPLYMSPEQARGHKDLDYRSDVWSFGIVLYQALSGHTPHRDTDMLGELLILICTEPPEPLQDTAPWVPAELALLVHRALRFDPGERFQSAAEMGAAIRALSSGDATITEAMVRPLAEGERAVVAPKLTQSLADAPPPRRTAGGTARSPIAAPAPFSTGDPNAAGIVTLPTGQVPPAPTPMPQSSPFASQEASYPPGSSPIPASTSPGSTTSGGAFGTTVGRPGEMIAGPAASSGSGLRVALAAVAAIAVLGGGAGIYALTRPHPDPSLPLQSSASALVPSPTGGETKPRTVRLVVIPEDASVEIEGQIVKAKEGLVEIRGPLGSVHHVRVFTADDEKTGDVVVTEDGAMPPKIELHSTKPRPTSGPAITGTGARPGPLPKASGAAAPPSDFRLGR